MTGPKVRHESWFAAAVLAVLTITVFERLRDYGPASAVRRFHAAVYSGDKAELTDVTLEPETNPHVRLLEINVLQDLEASKLHYEVARMDLAGREVRAAVIYYGGRQPFGNVIIHPVVFVLERVGSTWRVNAERTIFVQQQLAAAHA